MNTTKRLLSLILVYAGSFIFLACNHQPGDPNHHYPMTRAVVHTYTGNIVYRTTTAHVYHHDTYVIFYDSAGNHEQYAYGDVETIDEQ